MEYLGTQGAVQYRAGKFDAAIKTLEASLAIKGGNPEDRFFLALARFKSGQADDARRELETALKSLAAKRVSDPGDFSWSRDVELELLRAEAEKTLGAK